MLYTLNLHNISYISNISIKLEKKIVPLFPIYRDEHIETQKGVQ